MATYAQDHASALLDLTEAGSAVTFTHITPGVYDAGTDTWTDAVDASVSGYAIRTRGNPLRYQALNLVQSESPSLLFAPTTYGAQPVIGSTVTWGGVTYTCRDVEPVEPDGNAIICKVVVSR